jgi:ribosomal protein S8
MKTNTIDSSQVIEKLFDFILKEGLVKKFNLKEIKLKANDFYEELYALKGETEKQQVVEEIESFSLYDISNYNSLNVENIPSLIMTISVFKTEFIRIMTLGTDDMRYMDFGGLKRQVSPPALAYNYIGNNKLDINPTNRSHGFLYE